MNQLIETGNLWSHVYPKLSSFVIFRNIHSQTLPNPKMIQLTLHSSLNIPGIWVSSLHYPKFTFRTLLLNSVTITNQAFRCYSSSRISTLTVLTYRSRAVCQESPDPDHRGTARERAGYDPLCRCSAPSSASSSVEASQHPHDVLVASEWYTVFCSSKAIFYLWSSSYCCLSNHCQLFLSCKTETIK